MNKGEIYTETICPQCFGVVFSNNPNCDCNEKQKEPTYVVTKEQLKLICMDAKIGMKSFEQILKDRLFQ